jgi:type I restriction-modification system DNA methylase subunit/predicted type IV restriction endonuclease
MEVKISKDKAKEKLEALVKKFRLNEKHYKSLSETDIETKLVQELFTEILGWTKDDFFQQAKVMRGDRRGRADYEFRLGEKRVFYLEVKKVGIALNKEADKQVVSYALSKKNVPFAISTNFEQLKIFCVEDAEDNVFTVFSSPEQYISRFEDLWLLSRESFEKGLLLQRVTDEGRLKKRISIDKVLLEDLMHIRKLIAMDIEKRYPSKYSINEQEEIIQRILDRLIFIRRCEDTGIQPDDLRLFDITGISDERAYSKLKSLFEQYNSAYNSGLFVSGVDNDCDNITLNGDIIKKLIYLLYESKDKQYVYNFDWIDADVLGQVYEQYLGKILQQTKSGKATLKDGQAHRKEQGIYYTPTYVVDFIVKNTLGEFIKDNKTDISKIKILDPACGSGSFLIKAFDFLYNERKNEQAEQKTLTTDSQGFYSFKTEIIKNNLFGVDLDNKAVEITKLNLLLKASEKGRKLPEEVDLHIRHGNSLINDDTIAVKDYFKWEKDFQEGSFDVVVGNPPYGVEFTASERDFFRKNYLTASRVIDSYILFIEKATKLLKKDGVMGFIIPESWLTNPSNINLREYLIKNFSIQRIVDIPGMVFPDATVDTVILILKNKKDPDNKINIVFLESKNEIEIKSERAFMQKDYLQLKDYSMNTRFDKNIMNLIKLIEKDSIKLRDKCKNTRGIETGNNEKYLSSKKESGTFLPIITGDDIDRYLSPTNRYFVNYGSWLSNPKVIELFKGDKIVLQRIKNQNLKRRLVATIDTQNRVILDSVHMIYDIDAEYSPYYILALLNSDLLNFYFKLFSMYPRINADDLDNLPIKPISPAQQKIFIEPVLKILSLNNKIKEIGDKQTSEKLKYQEEINKIDEQINKDVYNLYGITKEYQETIKNY